MKLFLLVAMLCLASYSAHSQACGSISGNSVPTTSPNQSKYWVRVFYHILRMSNQTGGYASGQLCNITSRLNQDFNKYGIYITSTGFDYINNDNGYDLTPSYNPLAIIRSALI